MNARMLPLPAMATVATPLERERPALLVPSKGAQRIPTLAALLPEYRLLNGGREMLSRVAAVLAWGRKPSAARAAELAGKAGLPLVIVEDGFLRSVGTGDQDPPLALVIDDTGIYYDASRPSRLERLVAQPLDNAQVLRARALQALWRQERVSKYNAARVAHPRIEPGSVLVADQTFGDASLQGAGVAEFAAMLEAARRDHPEAPILLKVHPEVLSGRKQGHFDLTALQADPRVRVLVDDIHPAELLPQVAAVYVMTSQLGFDALLWGIPVHTFGMPFYAGWGLTRDALAAPSRRQPVSLEQLVHAALVDYARYVHPETGRPCSPEALIAWLGLQRRMRSRFPRQLQAVGFSRWKRALVGQFLQGSSVRLVEKLKRLRPGTPVVSWGRKLDDELERLGVPADATLRVEDGFLRSVGLGAGKSRPLSWVVDDLGIYYDATCPSRLERILLDTRFDEALLQRAAALREAICSAGITKYNLAGGGWARPAGREKVILVTGQVEDDASIRFGAHRIRRNLDLLKAVRAGEPDAWVLYKPHPEVLAGTRQAGDAENEAAAWCDEIVGDVPFHALLEAVDEVHVLTSQSGFEALLRGVPVTTYGQPFYAGWGLTRDLGLSDAARDRRQKVLCLDELVAGCLILYPTYVSLASGRFSTPERILYELQHWHELHMEKEDAGWPRVVLCWLRRAASVLLKKG